MASNGSGAVGRRGGQLRFDFARRGAGHHRQLADARAVVGDPVDQLVPGLAKFFRGHENYY